MNLARSVPFDKMSNLKPQLEKLETEHLGSGRWEVNQAREGLLAALRTFGHSRYELGRALRQYKIHFKAEQGWMAAASIIAAALDRDERTVFRILDDYERAAQLPAVVLEAMEVQNIDPAARKHTALVENLLQMPVPETREEAKAVVARAVKEQAKRKKQKRSAISKSVTTGFEEFGDTMVRRFQERYRSAPLQERDEELRYVLELVINTLRAPIVERRQFSQPDLVPKPEKRLVA